MYTPWRTSKAQDGVLDKAIARAAGGTVLLDIDGCLCDTRGRQLHIFHAWGELTGDRAASAVTLEHFTDRDLKRTWIAAGGDPATVNATYDAFRTFWWERFFDDVHVGLDRVMPGAARFVHALTATGAQLVYLTGRNRGTRAASEAWFRRYGFPLEGAIIADKPDAAVSDLAHKTQTLAGIVGPVHVTFDNEPENSNLFADKFPTAYNVFVETDSGKGEPYPHLPRIHGFLRTV